MIKVLLKLESLFFLLLALYFYNLMHGNWLMFLLLLFVPDISMIGYLKDKKLGAALYNLGHTYLLAVALLVWGIFVNPFLSHLGLILFAHIAIDRFFGYGLKLPTGFKDTHLGKIK